MQSGQVLAVIDDAQPRAAVDQATAAADCGGERSVRRRFGLGSRRINTEALPAALRKKSVSPQEFDEVKARYQAADARRDMARAGQAQANAALDAGSHIARLHADSRAILRA